MPSSDLPALNTFAAVARHGSFRNAARDLGLSPSAVSHAVAGLERRLGLRLLHRTTRSVALTPEGRVLLSGLSPALERIDKALDAARGVGPGLAGDLRIAAPPAVAGPLLLPLVLAFRTRFPGVDVVLQAGDMKVEPGGEPADLWVGFAQVQAKGHDQLALGHAARRVLVAAPSYCDAHGLPADPGALRDHVCIGCLSDSGAIRAWGLRRGSERMSIKPEARLVLDGADLVREAVLAGAGIAQGLEHDLRADLAAGRLVEVLPDWAERAERCFLCWPQHLAERPVHQAFIDFARRAGETVMAWHGRREG